MINWKYMPNFAAMKRLILLENQDHLTFNDKDLVIVDRFQNMPENIVYSSDYILIIICTEGKSEMSYDGRRVTLNKNELFLGVPGSVLSDYMLSPHYDCKVLAIKPSEATVPLGLHKQTINTAFYIKDHPVVKLNDEELDIFFSYYHILYNRVRKPSHRYYNSEIRTLLNTILLFILGTMDQDVNYSSTSTIHGEQIVEQFAKMVNDDRGCHRLVEYYAERLNITAKYLSFLVRHTLNRTPSDIIKVVTMKEIERKLRYTDESIKEISNSQNFPNTSFFGKYFKQHAGMTPNTYRKKYR